MTEYKRKLIEVALPLEAINKESAREKSIRHGHPSTLHLWWARRPLAACRAVLFASLVDDPSANPTRFPTEEAQHTERLRLFHLIEELVKWENITNDELLAIARDEILRSCDGRAPIVFDPFCGGGSIPLEAQRLGLEVHASDLNPVAVLITRALVQIPPKFCDQPPINPESRGNSLRTWSKAQGLAADVRYYGGWMRQVAQERLGHFYPTVALPREHGGGRATVIAWIWARTVKSPNPAWAAPVPLVRTFEVSTKPGARTWAAPTIDRAERRIRFSIRSGIGAPEGTVHRDGARCLVTDTAIPFEYIRAEARAGRMGAQLMAIVAEGPAGRFYLEPDAEQERLAASAIPDSAVADTELPAQALGFRVQAYGMVRHRDLFTARQLVAMTEFSNLPSAVHQKVVSDGGTVDYADAVATYLALAASRLADSNNALCSWSSSRDQTRNLFARQAVPMVWDFVENNPFAGAAGDLQVSVATVVRSIEALPAVGASDVSQADARTSGDSQAFCISTDPPYYDNIGYADLSDFFYVWLKRSMGDLYPADFGTLLVPKSQELVANPFRFNGDKAKAEQHFEAGLREVFGRLSDAQDERFPITIYYAFKQAEDDAGNGQMASTGWETMLEALLSSGLSVAGTWPMRTERGGRSIAIDTAALASSIVLVCRPRPSNASLATRKEFLTALRAELPSALRHLQEGNIAPVDLAQAAIGPGMGVFSRFARVVEADGSSMPVRMALATINRVLDETLAEQEGDFDRDTRWAVAWFEQYGMSAGEFGVAETLSKAKNSAVNALVDAGIVEVRAGKVQLTSRERFPVDWDPATDRRLTVWEVTQHLIRALETGGESSAAELVGRVGGLAETARELAYRLYNICERKRWAKDAISYNGIVVAWPAILRITAEQSGQAVQLSLGG
jgi:putative DNA methylase